MTTLEPICSPRVLEVLAAKVLQHLGLDFTGKRTADLSRRLQLLALEQEREPAAWMESLAFEDWDEALMRGLIPAFTVGETYFRRDAEALDWLAGHHLRPLLQRRRQSGHRHLRLWSAACCTGEEPYSLLFLLDELLKEERDGWKLELMASDINDAFLARAEQGCYGPSAFRGSEEGFRRHYFQAEGRLWRVRPAWRGRIRFLRHNLAAEALPDPAKGLAALDVILCRNVLMYFSAERAAATLHRLLGCLAEDGVLLLSAVEAGLATQAGFKGFWAGSNYALSASGQVAGPAPLPAAAWGEAARPRPRPVRRGALPVRPQAPPPVPVQQAPLVPQSGDPLGDIERLLACAEQAQAREALLAYLALPGLGMAQRLDACLLMARSWADQQRMGQAREWLQRALDIDPTALAAQWLQALLARQEGDSQAALQALRKVLYLDPECAMAHLHSGLLLRANGRRADGDRALRLCLQLAQRGPADALVPLGDGLGYEQLRQLCDQLLEGAACPSH
ncbi:CheR family methyltransferase [Pseudomonas sp. NPDC077186]|uniref:CheR family methyltransferase n=1 Tax=Pseudomonas sp. NPDC077186 TaxID=3364421 RepID=UPI0037CC3402